MVHFDSCAWPGTNGSVEDLLQSQFSATETNSEFNHADSGWHHHISYDCRNYRLRIFSEKKFRFFHFYFFATRRRNLGENFKNQSDVRCCFPVQFQFNWMHWHFGWWSRMTNSISNQKQYSLLIKRLSTAHHQPFDWQPLQFIA